MSCGVKNLLTLTSLDTSNLQKPNYEESREACKPSGSFVESERESENEESEGLRLSARLVNARMPGQRANDCPLCPL
jgi:hypothetical protein